MNAELIRPLLKEAELEMKGPRFEPIDWTLRDVPKLNDLCKESSGRF